MRRIGILHNLAEADRDAHGRYRPGSGTRTSSTRCGIPIWRRIDLRISGDETPAEPAPYGPALDAGAQAGHRGRH
jgi:hypothetical protein